MYTFYDLNGHEVRLTFADQPPIKDAKHVLIICLYNNQWVLTKHKKRGYEFPGGKVEAGETVKQAAKREVYEETGGIVKDIQFLGQYEVIGNDDSFVKSIYFAEIETFNKSEHYYETDGPVFLKDIEKELQLTPEMFSFIMKDKLVPLCLAQLRERFLSSER